MQKIILLAIALVLTCSTLFTDAFKWPIDENLPIGEYFTFSERYMFGTGEGPPIMEQGKSFIAIDLDFRILSETNQTVDIAYAIYSIAGEGRASYNLDGMCTTKDEVVSTNSYWANEIDYNRVTALKNDGQMQFYGGSIGLNGTYTVHHATIGHFHIVKTTAWHNVVFTICPHKNGVSTGSVSPQLLGSTRIAPGGGLLGASSFSSSRVLETDSSSDSLPTKLPLALITGEIAFRNPYGFIPGELYGMLPFEGARMVAYVLATCYFMFYYCRYREAVLKLHNMFLAVFLFALVEATLWYATYQSLNLSGQPYCCPFPPSVIVALLLQVVRQTMSRTMLLVVCLGYGIVRPKLLGSEWVAIGIVSAFYFIAAIVAQAADIIVVQNVHGDASDDTIYKIPAMFMDVIFLSWIYLAISSTIRILTEFQQTAKLNMYKSLVRIIGVFVVIFTVVTTFVLLDDKKIIDIPWQLTWLQQILWESLNFMVLLAICVVCKPTETSHLLSYAAQLPTEEPDDDFDDEELGDKFIRSGIKAPQLRSSEGGGESGVGDDGEEEEEYDGVELSTIGNSNSKNNKNMSSPSKYSSGLSLHKSTYKTASPLPAPAASSAGNALARDGTGTAINGFSSLPAAEEDDDEDHDKDLYDIAKD